MRVRKIERKELPSSSVHLLLLSYTCTWYIESKSACMPAQKTFNPMKKDHICRSEEDDDAEKAELNNQTGNMISQSLQPF